MTPSNFADLGWGAVAPVVLLGIVGALGLFILCFSRPRQGLAICILLLPIYLTYEPLLKALARIFGDSQTLIPADILEIVVFGGFLLTGGFARVHKRPYCPISLGLIAFIGAGLLSLLETPSLRRSAMELLAYCSLLVLVFIVEAVPQKAEDLGRMIRYWAYSYSIVLATGTAGLVSLASGWQNFVMNGQQVRAPFRFPNQLSLYLTITLPLLFGAVFGKSLSLRARHWIQVTLPLALAVLWFSGSRSGLAGVGAAMAGMGVLYITKPRVYVWAGMTILAVGLSYAVARQISSQGLNTSYLRFASVLKSLEDPDSPSSEFHFYEQTGKTSVDAFVASPIVGSGVGAVLTRGIDPGQPFQTHDNFLGILGETGLLGTSAFLLIIGLAVRNAWQARQLAHTPWARGLANGSLAALAGAMVHGLANFDWRVRHLWLLLALTSVVWRIARQEAMAIRREARKSDFRFALGRIPQTALGSN